MIIRSARRSCNRHISSKSNLSLLQAQDSLDQELAARALGSRRSVGGSPGTTIGVDTAERAAGAALAPVELRGSAFGLLAAMQRFGSLAASAIAVLWTLVSPRMAFRYLVVWTGIAVAALLATTRSRLG